jgi:transposase InsO family protein
VVHPIQFLDYKQHPVLIPAFFDLGSAISLIRRDALAQLRLPEAPTKDVFYQPDNTPLRPTSTVAAYFGIPDETNLALSTLYVVEDLFQPLLLGRRELKLLPVKLLLDGIALFEGASPPQPKPFPPELPTGQGVVFSGGDAYQQKLVTDVLLQYKSSVFEWSGTMGVFRDHVIDLPTSDDIPVGSKPYGVGPHQRQAFQDIIAEYLARDWIEPSTSPYGCPAFLHPKKTPAGQPQKWRLVEDYTLLNKKLQDDPHPVPTVQELIDSLGSKATWFISLDLTSGYHHCPLTVAARKKTAFVTPLGTYQYKVLPFGLKSAPRLFQRTLHTILKDHLYKYCLVYLDDVIIYGPSFNELLDAFRAVMATLSAAGAALGIKKCVFLAKEIAYLGHIISKGTVRPSPDATEAVTNFPLPSTFKELQRFIGLATYIRSHLPGFAQLEQRLRTTVSTIPGAKLMWTPDAQAAFNEVKQAVSKITALTIFDPDAAHSILADASATALGAVLFQHIDRGPPRPVAFASRVLTDAELRYTNSEREALALVWAVTKKFRPYVEGRFFLLGTDHKALLGEMKLKPHTARLARLMLKLAPYNYELSHIPATAMAAPDALSRITVAAVSSKVSEDPTPQQRQIIEDCHHQLGHAAWKKTYQTLRSRTTWPKLRQHVWRTLLACKQCLKFNSPPGQVGGSVQPVLSLRPREKLVVDVVGPLAPDSKNRKYALITVDHFSRFAVVQMLKRPTTAPIIRALQEVFNQLGSFSWVLSDPGPQFTSKAFAAFLRRLHIKQHLGSPGNFHSTGVVERLARTLKSIAAKMEPQDLTAHALLVAVQQYNRTPHAATKETPFAAFFGKPAHLPIDHQLATQPPMPSSIKTVAHNQQQYAAAWSARINSRRPVFKSGDTVMFYPRRSTAMAHAANRHLQQRASGPFTVITRKPFNRLLVSNPSGAFILPISRLRPAPFFQEGGELGATPHRDR